MKTAELIESVKSVRSDATKRARHDWIAAAAQAVRDPQSVDPKSIADLMDATGLDAEAWGKEVARMQSLADARKISSGLGKSKKRLATAQAAYDKLAQAAAEAKAKTAAAQQAVQAESYPAAAASKAGTEVQRIERAIWTDLNPDATKETQSIGQQLTALRQRMQPVKNGLAEREDSILVLRGDRSPNPFSLIAEWLGQLARSEAAQAKRSRLQEEERAALTLRKQLLDLQAEVDALEARRTELQTVDLSGVLG